ncbi:MAG: O-antigen ligase family protein [Candidatus Paceibacteria bacterium]
MKDILRTVVYGGLFLIPFLTLVVTESLFFPYITGKNFGFRIIVEVVVASWIVLALLDAQYRPKFSYVLASFTALMGVMLIATINAHHVPTALWSNFERMEGYVGLLHVFGYFLVLGSMLVEKKHWLWYFQVSVAVATFVALHGLSQLAAPDSTITRIDSTLGNSTYMAVYMLFHLFFVAYLFFQTQNPLLRVVYAVLSVLFLFVIFQTGTRGTALGLVAGAVTIVTYISLFGAKEPALRRYAIGAVVVLLICIAGFMGLRDTQYVQDNPAFSRIANINLDRDLAIRGVVWSMAGEGVKEKPILGWGMGNYNYVFNEQYDPRLYAQEQWFDRVHNIVLDWLIAGGAVGFIAYVLLFVSLIYYLFVRPYFYDEEIFSIAESAILIGLIIAYITHNLVVFDNIVSYIFFAVTLAYIHHKVAKPIPTVQSYQISPVMVKQVVFPTVLVVLVAIVYVVNVPAMLSAKGIITAIRTENLQDRYTHFDQVLAYGSFGQQEMVEQFVQQAISIARSQTASEEVKSLYLARAEQEINQQIANKPGDARLHVFAASFYRATGQTENAAIELAIARELSPNKQWIILQQGAVALTLEQNETARDYFKEAFLLDERFADAREYYVAALFLTGEVDTAMQLIEQADDTFFDRIVKNDFVVNAANLSGEKDFVISLFERRVELDGSVAQTWASLSFLYYEQGERQKSIDTLREGAQRVPAFKKTADCIEGNIVAGRAPETPCSQ